MLLSMRPYHDQTDYWQVRQFLRLLTGLNRQLDRSWSVVRFDFWRWHVHENIEHFRLDDVVAQCGARPSIAVTLTCWTGGW